MAARDTSEVWNHEATTFDEAADHGLRDPDVRAKLQAMEGAQ